jgi:hypothetical protein
MDTVTYVRIDVFAPDGKPLLSESHTAVYGPVGLLRVPGRLGMVVEDMLCFPSKDEAAGISNKGTLFDVFCASFKPESGPTISLLL